MRFRGSHWSAWITASEHFQFSLWDSWDVEIVLSNTYCWFTFNSLYEIHWSLCAINKKHLLLSFNSLYEILMIVSSNIAVLMSLSILFMRFLEVLVFGFSHKFFYFQFSLWDSFPLECQFPLLLFAFNSLYEILRCVEGICVFKSFALSILFMRFPVLYQFPFSWQEHYLSILFMRFYQAMVNKFLEYMNFQFSLWDSASYLKLQLAPPSSHFQFSLWDS